MPTLSTQVIRDPADLETLEPEWWRLWETDRLASPFQSPAWLIPWIREFAPNTLRCIVCRDNEGIAALLPLALDPGGGPGRERLCLCGSGISDTLDCLVADRTGSPAVEAALKTASGDWPDVEELCLDGLKRGSALLNLAPPYGWRDCGVRESAFNPVLGLAEATNLSDLISRRAMKNLAYNRRRAENAHRVTISRADERNVGDLFEILVVLHRKRWAERGKPGVLDDPAVQRFHRAALPRLMASGIARLDVLWLDDQPAAAVYSLVAKGRWHYYIGGFDPRFARLSIGSLTVAHAIEQALAESCDVFDFLRGGEDYKYRWGARDVPLYSRHLTRDGNGSTR